MEGPGESSLTAEERRRRYEALDRWLCGSFPRLHKSWPRPMTKLPKPAIAEYIHSVHPFNPASPRLLAMVGGRGTGKTQAATDMGWAWNLHSPRSEYTTAFAMFQALKEAFGNSEQYKRAWAFYALAKFLVIDELQERSEGPWEKHVLTELLDLRYREMRTTVLISNLTHEEFKDSVGPSVYDRLRECGAVLVFDWPSFRAAKPRE